MSDDEKKALTPRTLAMRRSKMADELLRAHSILRATPADKRYLIDGSAAFVAILVGVLAIATESWDA